MEYPLITGGTVFDAVILGNGGFPTAGVPLEILRNASYLCCCDGAGVALIEDHGIMPQAIVGDGDSMPEDFKRRYAGIIHIVNEQEDNDQTKATRHCMDRGFRRLAYLGATGRREDHTLGNVSLLVRYAVELGLDVTMVTDYGCFVVTQGPCRLQTVPQQQVSLFNVSCSEIAGEGFRWPTYAYRSFWQGTLNEAVGDSVTLRTDGCCVVYRTFGVKK